jgi:hypothetical protein
MPRPADTIEFRGVLGRFVEAYVLDDPSVLGARMLRDDIEAYLSVATSENAEELPRTFEGIPVRVHRREPSMAAVGPLR